MFTVDDVAEAILPFADVHGELRYEGSLHMVLPSQVPVEVCRLTHLFVHETGTTRQSRAHRRNLIVLSVAPQSISDYFVEVTKAVPRAEGGVVVSKKFGAGQFSKVLTRIRALRALLTPRAFNLASCVKPSSDTMKSNDLKDIPSPSGCSTRAPSVDVSSRSPKSPKSPALLGYPLSPTGSARQSTGLWLPLTLRSVALRSRTRWVNTFERAAAGGLRPGRFHWHLVGWPIGHSLG